MQKGKTKTKTKIKLHKKHQETNSSLTSSSYLRMCEHNRHA